MTGPPAVFELHPGDHPEQIMSGDDSSIAFDEFEDFGSDLPRVLLTCDGCTLVEFALGPLLRAAPDRFMVHGAGNYVDSRTHAGGRVESNRSGTLTVEILEADGTAIEIGHSNQDEFSVRVGSPSGHETSCVRLGEQADAIEVGRVVGRAYQCVHGPNNRDHHRGTDGMHVIDIAAGKRLAGGPIGIAPRASLTFEHLGEHDTSGPANLGDSARILEVIDFIFRLPGDRPCVINLSVGKHGGSHDRCTLTELALDSTRASAPNRCVVQRAGNYFGKPIHASGRLSSGSVRSLTLVTHEYDHTPNEFAVWYSGEGRTPDHGRVAHRSANSVGSAGPVHRHRRERPGRRAPLPPSLRPQQSRQPGGPLRHPFSVPLARGATLRAKRVLSGVFHAWVE